MSDRLQVIVRPLLMPVQVIAREIVVVDGEGNTGGSATITYSGGIASTVIEGGITLYWPASTTPPTP